MAAIDRIALIGFSGTGKTTVARLLAERLSWAVVDTDEEIERAAGESIPEIFFSRGEPAFREMERRVLLEALGRGQVVVATGGGAVVDPVVWNRDLLGNAETLVVALDVMPETTLSRLREQQAQEGGTVARPLLAGDEPLARITQLKSSRQSVYDRADVTLVVDRVSPAEVVAEIAALLPAAGDDRPTVCLDAPSGRSEIYIAPFTVERLGGLVRRRWPQAARCWVITDENVGRLHLSAVESRLQAAGLRVEARTVPPGEQSKRFDVAGSLLDWMLDGGVERTDVVVALGGGMVGDLAGFVAATCLRGIGLVQAPTTLLAMVDSSVGGKTAVNHRTGKNLIGSFYQPHLVVIDPRFLATLPERELVSGWAEVLKHGVIQASTPGGQRADLLTFYERNADGLTERSEPASTYAIRRNVALKAAVVEADEREADIRAFLNYGHTLGHAIEAAGYRYLHGEAIAAGMRAAGHIGRAMGTATGDSTNRFDALLAHYGLTVAVDVDPERTMTLVASDKKRAAGRTRWVLPLAAGGVTIRDDVPDAVVRDSLAAVLEPARAADRLPG